MSLPLHTTDYRVSPNSKKGVPLYEKSGSHTTKGRAGWEGLLQPSLEKIYYLVMIISADCFKKVMNIYAFNSNIASVCGFYVRLYVSLTLFSDS